MNAVLPDGGILMKRTDLIKILKRNGWTFKRDGGNHDIWTDGKYCEPIPHHREINEMLAKAIIRKYDLK